MGVTYDQKYEAHGGPGIADILQILARAERASEDRRTFALAQFAFWLLAAIDGHAKNFSIYHHRGGAYGLTPLYDVLSAWPVIGHGANRLELKKGETRNGTARQRSAALQAGRDPAPTLRGTRHLADPELWPAMTKLAEEVPGAIERVEAKLPDDFASSVWTSLTQGLKRQAAAFLKAAIARS
jgi:serine/threonine-protein kinase HipA